MMSLSSTPAIKCDCERQPSETSSDKDVPGAERSLSKQKPEEVFAGGISPALPSHFMDPASNTNEFVLEDTSKGYSAVLLEPPRCRAPYSSC